MKIAQKSRKRASRFAMCQGMNAVNLAAIACGENQRLFQNAVGAQHLCGALRLFQRKSNSLPHLQRCSAKVQTNENNFHIAGRAPLKHPSQDKSNNAGLKMSLKNIGGAARNRYSPP